MVKVALLIDGIFVKPPLVSIQLRVKEVFIVKKCFNHTTVLYDDLLLDVSDIESDSD